MIAANNPIFDRTDIAEAYYMYLSHTYRGQGDVKYKRLCKLLGWFRPRPSLKDETHLSPNGREIYIKALRKAILEHRRQLLRDKQSQAASAVWAEFSATVRKLRAA